MAMVVVLLSMLFMLVVLVVVWVVPFARCPHRSMGLVTFNHY